MTDHHDGDALRYALAKQVPAMERGFTIQTSYGDLAIGAKDAGPFVALARSVLARKEAGEPSHRAVWADASASFMRAKYLFEAIAEATDIDRMAALAGAGEELMRAAELRADDAMMGRPAEVNDA
ncbi:hypothetical protein ACVCIH_09580 [Burkholderia glumae]|uniref:hypothetical protein n=1 Tax=Burkholderia glumae TaxID=337 RepID=UPI0020368A78|nr:hypothetical protein [Burkholderia glumae]MCM2493056.1 hypothetical protein [Burkholderia glumae]